MLVYYQFLPQNRSQQRIINSPKYRAIIFAFYGIKISICQAFLSQQRPAALIFFITDCYYNYFRMRLFVHLRNFNIPALDKCKSLKILQKYHNNSDPIFFLQLVDVDTTDGLMRSLAEFFAFAENECIIRIVMIGNTSEKKVRLAKGYKLKDYCALLGDLQFTIFHYQLEIEIERVVPSILDGPAKQINETQNSNVKTEEKWEQLPQQLTQVYKFSYQLFQILQHDDLFEFKNTLNILLKYKPQHFVRILLNLYSIENGYTLLHTAIYYNKYDYLAQILNEYGQFINVNHRSLDGWLPFELALAIGNKKAVDILLTCRSINLNLNYPTKSEKLVYQLINSMNLDLIEQTIKRTPLHFQQISQQGEKNVYDYLWKHKRFTPSEKRDIIGLMHQKHLQFLDYYRADQILIASCRNYLPTATRRLSPKKEVIYNPNLKIVSGELIKCRVPPHFSKHIFISVNCYIGAIEEYEINSKLNLKNDRQKLEEYQKTKHISLEEIDTIELLAVKDKSWYMKKEWFCFVVKEKRGARTVFACQHESTSNQWVSQIQQAINAWNSLEHKMNNSNTAKNYIKIVDADLKVHTSKKLTQRGYLDLFSKRLSLCEPMENSIKTSKSLNVETDQPVLKSKSQYNTTVSTSMANEEVLPLSLQFKDFKMLQLLGEGAFGQVFLVECLRNHKFYALKTFSKKKIILSKQTKFVIAEVNILKQIRHPYIITLNFTFQTPSYIYLGLEYCQGKDMSKHINQQLTFPEEDVRIYAAEIVLALEYIHNLGVIYRDLKPQNIMLGKDGHIMLVDFGLSKKAENNFAKTFCGSPAYLSPEMLEKHGVGRQTDFFSLGVVIFQFIFGEPPFYSDNIHLLYQNIQNGVLTFPRKINEVTKDFLEKLLRKEPKNRLGSGSIMEIKSHPFFATIQWQKLMRKQIAGPKRVLLDDIESVQSEEQLINMFHDDFDYSESNYKVNRFKNFSFVREDQFL